MKIPRVKWTWPIITLVEWQWPWVRRRTHEALEREADRLREEERRTGRENGIYAALLADLVEALGDTEHTPKMMWYAHAGWVCGPGSKKDMGCVTFLDCWEKLQEPPSSLRPAVVDEWRSFIERLTAMKVRVARKGERP